jgi:ribonucleoside-diphosphate reductase alpha chain
MALIHQSGGGVGFSFSRLRPEGSIVRTSRGIASGPVSFMKIFDVATDVIKQGGRRRGANMGVLDADHPDILKFVSAKERGNFRNFNISVGVSDRFMEAVKKKNPKSAKIFNEIVSNAWETGDPGIIFLDEINRKHPLKGRIEATNPCGEQPLLPYESCNLGSINLSNMVSNGNIDWDKLRKTVRLGVHFLDNVIDISKFPLPQIDKITKANRKIGLGVMGFAEMLIKIGVSYDSKKAVDIAEKVMKFIADEARTKSEDLGKKKGSFRNFRNSRIADKYWKMRNATVTTIAPTGTISIIAGTSSGIEPLFAVKFTREILGQKKFTEENPLWKSKKYDEKLFVTAMDVKPEQHVRIQAAFQKHTDNAVSKTVNLKPAATKADVRKIFMLAYALRCKGITVYRYGSKEKQVLCVEC